MAFLFSFCLSHVLSAQENDSTGARINSFGGAVTIQSKGISTIPNLTLGKPAAVFDMKVGRKLTFEPQIRFALDGKPWAMVFWWRYYASFGNKVKVTFHTNYSLAYKSLTYYTASGNSQEIIRTTRYLVGALEPTCQINKYLNAGVYLFYNYGIEKFITRNTYMFSFRTGISNIPVAEGTTARITPEIYYLKMDGNEGVFFNARLSVSNRNFPVSVSALVNKPLKSNIPSEYDFLWHIAMSYSFGGNYTKAP
ncbi:MAG: hypothetical protein GX431_03975 [Bacteroidales bacterium]|nr:hypothetical protein [Bacteroidales bacterium]